MSVVPKHIEIDHHTMKLIVGVIALSLAALTNLFAENDLQSISAAYHDKGVWARNIFVGFLFAIAAFLAAYNGRSALDMLLSRIAALAAIGVAMFPCSCEIHTEIVPYVHGGCACVLFVILAIFCYGFYKRARDKGHMQARVRAFIYAVCAIVMLGGILVMAFDYMLDDKLSAKINRLTFYGEASALIAFGVAWLIASRVLPFFTARDERISLSPYINDKQT